MTNVTRLPTAARRQPRNHRFVAQSYAAVAMRKAEPWPGTYLHPQDREADKLAAELAGIEQHPATILLSALLRVIDGATYAKVIEQLAPAGVSEHQPCRQALAVAKMSRLNLGQAYDLRRALDRRNGGEA